MNLFSKAVVVIAATGVMGYAQAQDVFNMGTLSPTVQTQTDIVGAGSFADIFNFTVDASHNVVSTNTIGSSVTGLQLELFSGFNAAGTALYTGLDLNAALLTPGEFSAKISGTAGPLGGTLQFSIAATPEPAEWVLLLFGLAVVGFIARRKIALGAGAPAYGA